MNPSDFVEGLAKGLRVLEAFDTERQRLNATLTAQRTGLTRTAARRYLLTLHSCGYLESDGLHYWLSPRCLRLAGCYIASSRLPKAAQPILNALSVQTGGAFSVVVLDGPQCVIVARSIGTLETLRHTAYGLHVGARLPAHATSTGLVLLASLNKTQRTTVFEGHTLTRLTPYTPIRWVDINAWVNKIRRQDHCLARETHEIGVHALAVPVRNLQGAVVAALNIVGDAHSLTDQQVSELWLPSLRQASLQLGQVI